ncbi:MAG: PTS sugar transporter subunit IIA [Verrucomicrobia bacterium]|nr:PTS sugar transporter subunit IIA [Verrucomicrobiota bacterium]
MLTTNELADYMHVSASDVERLLRDSDIPKEERGGRLVFRRSEIDAWASQRILGMPDRRLDAYHEKSMRGTQNIFDHAAILPELIRSTYINLDLTSKTRSSAIRDMVALAESTGNVFDSRELLTTIEARETLCSTALPGGLALLHARNYDAYRFERSFIVLGRTIQTVPFGAPDGGPTRLFFLICCQDDRIHLHTLARLCLIAMKTDILSQLYEVPDANAAYNALLAAEQAVLPEKKAADA